MANPEQIEQELRMYLEEERNLSKPDRLIHLMAIFNKHFGLDATDHLINDHDLHDIISYAKSIYAQKTMPIKISRSDVPNNHATHVLIMESFIMYLNKSKLLKKLVKFDYTR